MINYCVSKNGITIKYIPEEKQTIEICKKALNNVIGNININKYNIYKPHKFIKFVKYFDGEMVNTIINFKHLVMGIKYVPINFITKEYYLKAMDLYDKLDDKPMSDYSATISNIGMEYFNNNNYTRSDRATYAVRRQLE